MLTQPRVELRLWGYVPEVGAEGIGTLKSMKKGRRRTEKEATNGEGKKSTVDYQSISVEHLARASGTPNGGAFDPQKAAET